MRGLAAPGRKQLVLPHSGGRRPSLPGSTRPATGLRARTLEPDSLSCGPSPTTALASCLNALCLSFPINAEGVIVRMLRAFSDAHLVKCWCCPGAAEQQCELPLDFLLQPVFLPLQPGHQPGLRQGCTDACE